MEKSKVKEAIAQKKDLTELIKKKDYDGLTQHMKEGIKDYLDGETFTRYLQFVSRFHQYPFNDIQLILAQNSQISRIASFQLWKKIDRHV